MRGRCEAGSLLDAAGRDVQLRADVLLQGSMKYKSVSCSRRQNRSPDALKIARQTVRFRDVVARDQSARDGRLNGRILGMDAWTAEF